MTGAALIALVLNGGLLAPPAQFNHEPVAAYVVDIVPHKQLPVVCGKPKGEKVRVGCAMTNKLGSFIFITDAVASDKRAYAIVFRHERAHLNGWKHR